MFIYVNVIDLNYSLDMQILVQMNKRSSDVNENHSFESFQKVFWLENYICIIVYTIHIRFGRKKAHKFEYRAF